jgi:hypothetical protein
MKMNKKILPIFGFMLASLIITPVLAYNLDLHAAVDGRGYIRISRTERYRGDAELSFYIYDPDGSEHAQASLVITLQVDDSPTYVWCAPLKPGPVLKKFYASPHPDVAGFTEGPSKLKVIVYHRGHGMLVVAVGRGVFFAGKTQFFEWDD